MNQKSLFARIKKAAKKIQRDSDILVVIGIGGSYLGARAVIEALSHSFNNMMPHEKHPIVLFAGNNLSPVYMNDLLEVVAEKDISVNVISKSGTTTEPAIAFRIFREVLETKYGVKEARKRIYVTTDRQKGALKTLAGEEKYETFVVPDNMGGRFSVLSAVGLLPIAAAGINIDKLMSGARKGMDNYSDSNIKYNDAQDIPVTAMINPTWKKLSDDVDTQYEGCMSVPQIRGKVQRYKEIELTYFDEKGAKITKQLNGFFARLIQHECDHLDGIVFLEKVIPNGYATLDMIKYFELRK